MKDLSKGIVVSLIIHGVLAGIFLFIVVPIKLTAPEFVEIGFISWAPPQPEQKGLIPQKTEGGLLEIPETKYTEEEPPIFEPTPIEKKEIPGIEKITAPKESPSIAEEEGKQPYTIRGEIAKRKIINKVIPEYPKGYNEETEVVIKLTVAPDGIIIRKRVVKTGGKIFDEITLNALMEWKFERLPTSLPQNIQEGEITFVYKLR